MLIGRLPESGQFTARLPLSPSGLVVSGPPPRALEQVTEVVESRGPGSWAQHGQRPRDARDWEMGDGSGGAGRWLRRS